MKSLMSLLQSALADASVWCCTSTTRDFETISRRVEHEGLSFLTITLPTFAKDFERSLDDGMVSSTMFTSFSKHGSLPRLFSGLTSLVFDPTSGVLLDNPSVCAIFYVRQLTLMFKKILLPCSLERDRSAFERYVECESDLTSSQDSISPELLRDFDRICSLLWSTDLCHLDRKVYDGDLVPKHGPGATAEKLYGNAKFLQQSWTSRLEEFFPVGDYLIPNAGFFDRLGTVEISEPDAETPVRVVTVPKTLKTPRIIAIEPACMMYTQQALMEELVSLLERSSYLSDSVGFSDQSRNRDFARDGSKDGSLATIDLSDASDRVSNQLVLRLLRPFPSLSGAVQACRSTHADVPGFGVMPLTKFASMGSALCFPMEAMVFLTIVCIGIEKELSTPFSKQSLRGMLARVRVYGDDIIVPTEYVRSVVSCLSAFCMRVNTAKSFWTGKFRESCGGDYYDGEDVTVSYCRRKLPTQRNNVSEILSAVSLRNQFYRAGMWKTAEWLEQYLKELVPLPTVLDTSPVVGRHSFLGFETHKLCPNLHIPLVRGMVTKPKPRSSKLDDYGALLKFFLKRGVEPFFDAKHLERYGRPESVDIKIRWASAI